MDHMHLVIPRYLGDWIEKLVEKHHTSRSYEVSVCILMRYLNSQES